MSVPAYLKSTGKPVSVSQFMRDFDAAKRERDEELRKEGLHPEQLKGIADDAKYAGMSEMEIRFWKGFGF